MSVRSPAGPGNPTDAAVTLDVSVLGREYKVACAEHERAELVEAVRFLDQRMRQIRDSGKVTGVERIAVMAALNIANELLRAQRGSAAQSSGGYDGAAAQRKIEAMRSAIDQVLDGA
ncbi:MAG: cell division protein ZapA [Pseudomonadota bacterium]|nr:cell division protein ZapA [Pseudomonadota bacterium]